MSKRRSITILLGAIVSSISLTMALGLGFSGNYLSAPVATAGVRPMAVDVDETNGLVYAVNHASDTLAVIEAATGRLVTTLPTDDAPSGVVVNESTNKIYVSHYGSDFSAAGHTVKVYNAAEGFSISTIELGAGIGFRSIGIAADPTLNKIYVANTANDSLSIINGLNDTLVTNLPVGDFPTDVTVNPANGKVYVANYGADVCQVSSTDPSPGTYVAGICTGYINNTSEVTVVDGTTNGILSRIRDAGRDNGPITRLGGPYAIDINTTTNLIYVGQRRAQAQEGTAPGRIGILDGATDTFIDYFSATNGGRGPGALGIDSSRNRLWWSPLANDTTTVRGLDLSTAGNPTRVVGGSFKSLGTANVLGAVLGIEIDVRDGSVYSASLGTTNPYLRSIVDNPTQILGNPGAALICTPTFQNCNPGMLGWIQTP